MIPEVSQGLGMLFRAMVESRSGHFTFKLLMCVRGEAT